MLGVLGACLAARQSAAAPRTSRGRQREPRPQPGCRHAPAEARLRLRLRLRHRHRHRRRHRSRHRSRHSRTVQSEGAERRCRGEGAERGCREAGGSERRRRAPQRGRTDAVCHANGVHVPWLCRGYAARVYSVPSYAVAMVCVSMPCDCRGYAASTHRGVVVLQQLDGRAQQHALRRERPAEVAPPAEQHQQRVPAMEVERAVRMQCVCSAAHMHSTSERFSRLASSSSTRARAVTGSSTQPDLD